MGQIFGPIGYFFNLIFTYPILNALLLLYHLFGDMALSIIVLTVIIRLLLFLGLRPRRSHDGAAPRPEALARDGPTGEAQWECR